MNRPSDGSTVAEEILKLRRNTKYLSLKYQTEALLLPLAMNQLNESRELIRKCKKSMVEYKKLLATNQRLNQLIEDNGILGTYVEKLLRKNKKLMMKNKNIRKHIKGLRSDVNLHSYKLTNLENKFGKKRKFDEIDGKRTNRYRYEHTGKTSTLPIIKRFKLL